MKYIKNLKIGLVFICILFGLNNCTKINDTEPENSFVSGEILFSPKDSIPLEDLFNSLSAYDTEFKLIYLYKYKYLIDNPTFDKEYYSNIINSKEYLKSGNLVSTVVQIKTKINFDIRFFKIDDKNLRDWIETRNEMNLKRVESDVIHGLLNVEVGTETDWINKLNSNPHIKFAQLNHNNVTIR